MSTFTVSQQRTLHKHSHGWLPTGNHMEHRYQIRLACPHCIAPENNEHLVQCVSQTEHQLHFIHTLKTSLKTSLRMVRGFGLSLDQGSRFGDQGSRSWGLLELGFEILGPLEVGFGFLGIWGSFRH